MTAKKTNWIESWWITLNVKMKKLRSHDGRIFKMYVAAFFLSLSVIVVFAQTNSEHKRRDNSVYAELAKAPKKAAARHNPLQADPDAVAAGGKLFVLHCAECHGDMAEGGKKAPSLLAPEVQQATPGTLFWLLTNGVVRRGMPVWSKLPEPQRWQLVRFIKSLGPAPQPNAQDERTPDL
jgi:mono/diheme cytochrome c family protein